MQCWFVSNSVLVAVFMGRILPPAQSASFGIDEYSVALDTWTDTLQRRTILIPLKMYFVAEMEVGGGL